MIYQFGMMLAGRGNLIGIIAAFAVLAVFVFLIIRKPSAVKGAKA